MRLRIAMACGAMISGAVVGPAPAPAQENASPVETMAREFRETHRIPALVVGMLRGDDDELVTLGGVGPTTLFEIGSITKVFVALLLAEMAARGEIGLDDHLVSHLTEPAAANPALGHIRLVHLATHRSGLPRLPPNLRPTSLTDPYAGYDVRRLEADLATIQSIRPPGTYTYSNLGAGVLGHVLVRRGGVPLERLVEDRIARPGGLRNTAFPTVTEPGSGTPSGRENDAVAVPHAGESEVPGWRFASLGGAGGMWSTASDLLRFLRLQLAPPGGSLGDAIRESQKERAMGPGAVRMALGWHVMRLPHAGPLYFHNGATGGSRSFLAFAPDSGTGVVVLVNRDVPPAAVNELGLRLVRLLQPVPGLSPPSPPPSIHGS